MILLKYIKQIAVYSYRQ